MNAAWRIVGLEALIMAAVMSLGTVLGRTAPPTPDTPPELPSPARLLSGYELPPELTANSWLTVWRFDWLWVAIIILLAAMYIIAMIKVRRRGDTWPILRLAAWIVGLVALFYITSGAPAVYGMVLFSVHMVDHMALTMVAPLFMVMGAPVTLALKALPRVPTEHAAPASGSWCWCIRSTRHSSPTRFSRPRTLPDRSLSSTAPICSPMRCAATWATN